MVLTSSLSRLNIGEGNAVGNDGVPVDVALVGRDVNTLGLSPLFKVLSELDSGAEDGGGEEECRRESFEVEEHRCCVSPILTPLSFYTRIEQREYFASAEKTHNRKRLRVVHLADTDEFDKWGQGMIMNLSQVNRVLWE